MEKCTLCTLYKPCTVGHTITHTTRESGWVQESIVSYYAHCYSTTQKNFQLENTILNSTQNSHLKVVKLKEYLSVIVLNATAGYRQIEHSSLHSKTTKHFTAVLYDVTLKSHVGWRSGRKKKTQETQDHTTSHLSV